LEEDVHGEEVRDDSASLAEEGRFPGKKRKRVKVRDNEH